MQIDIGMPTAPIDILDCKPPGVTLRQVQIDYLKWVETNYDKFDVFVGVMPTATGKSIAFMTLAEWVIKVKQGSMDGIVPNKMLQDQYAKDFEDLIIVKGMSNYKCEEIEGSCERYKKFAGKCCGGPEKCPYIATIAAAKRSPLALFNYHIYTPLKIIKTHLCLDEGHNAIPYLYSLFAVNIWKCEDDYPDDIGVDPAKIAEWISTVWMEKAHFELTMLMAKNNDAPEAKKLEERIQKMTDVVHGLKMYPNDFIIQLNADTYYKSKVYRDTQVKGTRQEFLYIKPKKIDKMGDKILWPKAVQKIFFLSATISEIDMGVLGLENNDKYRVGYFECDSPIPPENRPFIRWPVANMSSAQRAEGIPKVVEAIKKLAEKHKDEKGLVHCTYETAKALRNSLKGHRFLFHTEKDKAEVYQRFRDAKYPAVLIASGMSEGIDLPDDAARWQVITQVMHAYLGDAVNKWISQTDANRYKMMTIQVIEQQSGRIVRHPLDKGVTYCLDSQFDRLYDETHTYRIAAGKKSMWHNWFIQGVRK